MMGKQRINRDWNRHHDGIMFTDHNALMATFSVTEGLGDAARKNNGTCKFVKKYKELPVHLERWSRETTRVIQVKFDKQSQVEFTGAVHFQISTKRYVDQMIRKYCGLSPDEKIRRRTFFANGGVNALKVDQSVAPEDYWTEDVTFPERDFADRYATKKEINDGKKPNRVYKYLGTEKRFRPQVQIYKGGWE